MKRRSERRTQLSPKSSALRALALLGLIFGLSASLPAGLGSWLVPSATAQEAAPDPAPTPANDNLDPAAPPEGLSEHLVNPLFWRATNGEHTVYLLGSIHAGVSLSEMPPQLRDAVDSSPVVVLEADVMAVNPFRLLQLSMYQPGQGSLREHFTDEQWAALLRAVGTSIPEAMLPQYKPWFLYT
ncbi:MAG: TraB/GumN family protein, partial [Myxococcales bacterium]|nr:TraB/GumN family protein [Myxococcales bacterium]